MESRLLRSSHKISRVIYRQCCTEPPNFRSVKLSYVPVQIAKTESKRPPLLMMHGMFGNKKNLETIAKVLSKTGRKIISMDARNHGESPHTKEMDYFLMSEDIEQLMQDLGLNKAIVLGHSMGGKAAMVLALTKPHLVSKLIVADISPDITRTAGSTGFPKFIAAMKSVKFGDNVRVLSEARREASRQLQVHMPDKALRDFVITNIEEKDNQFQWRVNLDAMYNNIQDLVSFPRIKEVYQGDTLFIRGGNSTAISEKHEPEIRRLFPESRMITIHGAGHWVHAEKPYDFIRAVQGFIDEAT